MENRFYSAPCVGSEIKINVNVEPHGVYHLSDYDFKCRFYTTQRSFIDVTKQEMIKLDNDNYIACIDTTRLGNGEVLLVFEAHLPDNDFADGYRTEIARLSTGVTIQR